MKSLATPGEVNFTFVSDREKLQIWRKEGIQPSARNLTKEVPNPKGKLSIRSRKYLPHWLIGSGPPFQFSLRFWSTFKICSAVPLVGILIIPQLYSMKVPIFANSINRLFCTCFLLQKAKALVWFIFPLSTHACMRLATMIMGKVWIECSCAKISYVSF